MVYIDEVRDGSKSDLGEERDVNSDKVRSMNLIDEDGGLEVIAISEERVKGDGELRRKDNSFPLIMFSSKIELGHGFSKAGCEVGVR